MKVLFDVEANGYLEDATKVHCICVEEFDTGIERDFFNLKDFLLYLDGLPKGSTLIAHNGLAYDFPLIEKLSGNPYVFDRFKKLDTMVVSKLVRYKLYNTHSLKELGEKLKVYKGEYTGGFEFFSKEMLEYCHQDVVTLKAIYRSLVKYIDDPSWAKAIQAEHEMSTICLDMETNGFCFNKEEAYKILEEIELEMGVLESSFGKEFNSTLIEDKRLKMQYLKSGGPAKKIVKAMTEYPRTRIDGDELICYKYREFNPGSPTDRIDVLNEAGWSPYEKTKGHLEYLRDLRWKKTKPDPKRAARFEKYGWKVNEDNLKTLPPTAPQAAHDLAAWLTLEGRRSSVQEWINQVQPDGKIHGKFWHIGAWTQRMSHSNPNQGNIFATWDPDVTPKNDIERIKERYDTRLRALWTAEPGKYLVGTDADAIQLRVLAHYMDSEVYIKAILEGKKEDGTDIHNVNKSALGPICRSRDDAKTFIYAWLLGAGVPKVASILGCSITQARQAIQNFLDSLPELKRLKQSKIPYDARVGYFTGLDGRKVICNSEHLMLSGYLQEGESTIMKHANILWRERLAEMGVSYKQLDFVHDEWVVQCDTMEEAKVVGDVQAWAITQAGIDLGLKCPLSGTPAIGHNWAEVH